MRPKSHPKHDGDYTRYNVASTLVFNPLLVLVIPVFFKGSFQVSLAPTHISVRERGRISPTEQEKEYTVSKGSNLIRCRYSRNVVEECAKELIINGDHLPRQITSVTAPNNETGRHSHIDFPAGIVLWAGTRIDTFDPNSDIFADRRTVESTTPEGIERVFQALAARPQPQKPI